MLRKNNGVTLVLLVIMVIIMLILLGVTINTSTDLIKDSRLKKYITTMQLVQAKAASIYENYTFSGEDEDVLAGLPATLGEIKLGIPTYNPDSESDLWYKWNSSTASEQKIETDLLDDGAYFLVNYTTGDVIYSKGFTSGNGSVVYLLEEMKSLT